MIHLTLTLLEADARSIQHRFLPLDVEDAITGETIQQTTAISSIECAMRQVQRKLFYKGSHPEIGDIREQ